MPSEPSPNRSLNILLVEDDPNVQNAVAKILTKHHHTVRRAWGVESALAALAEAPCEVLISDIGLPDGTGWHLVERAGRERCPYAIAISGFNSSSDVADSEASGFQRHLSKPFAAGELIAALEVAAAALSEPARQAR
jgi:two-component system CheB/CheR fusion protein